MCGLYKAPPQSIGLAGVFSCNFLPYPLYYKPSPATIFNIFPTTL